MLWAGWTRVVWQRKLSLRPSTRTTVQPFKLKQTWWWTCSGSRKHRPTPFRASGSTAAANINQQYGQGMRKKKKKKSRKRESDKREDERRNGGKKEKWLKEERERETERQRERASRFLRMWRSGFTSSQTESRPGFTGAGAADSTTHDSRATWSVTFTSAKSFTPCSKEFFERMTKEQSTLFHPYVVRHQFGRRQSSSLLNCTGFPWTLVTAFIWFVFLGCDGFGKSQEKNVGQDSTRKTWWGPDGSNFLQGGRVEGASGGRVTERERQ